ncbi:FtsQ-type POTRA domain-containing protein [Rhodoblastus acidophilus]|uniref:Cell division protein FtsQ n=1 Tax=Candidatus Rhodoblastus alkanivorans TaxID=2954117 RepID=A0ABS9Z9T7_9HYPH|nr:FtsQ-type POTRA domain-containing protein [Candidatus Rhodoblastus alkanivorans]MCI4679512.1 FtsQ-type POTRA domain-containing protein [Candidatus Rhodoblastus alkanivorans]MCI4683957.1 FtsQ-type POTRA domain-containing protein [Candidatus Rhodoblastus alkanivorans]MDI4641276.1 FtsQ-type POTRA domain-containing protein [Rhodoblastus acidophilus]
MDGGRRLLRSVDGLDPALASPRAAVAGAAAGPFHGFSFFHPRSPGRAGFPARRRPRVRHDAGALTAILRLPGLGSALAVAFLVGAGLLGVMENGQYAAFVQEYGAPRDIVARAIGFGIDSVTIAGQVEVTDKEILAIAGVNAKQSLLFIDANEMRNRLLALPLIKDASVRKYFPDRLVIDVTERRPYGLWQKDGAVSIVARDGARIDTLNNPKFETLPFVVGDGANERIGEYVALLDAAGAMRSKIRAGVLVSQRRWNLKMKSGVDVLLPEVNPKEAVATLAQLEREYGVLEKAVVTLDLRVPGKLYIRLTEEAAAAREAAHTHGKGAH